MYSGGKFFQKTGAIVYCKKVKKGGHGECFFFAKTNFPKGFLSYQKKKLIFQIGKFSI